MKDFAFLLGVLCLSVIGCCGIVSISSQSTFAGLKSTSAINSPASNGTSLGTSTSNGSLSVASTAGGSSSVASTAGGSSSGTSASSEAIAQGNSPAESQMTSVKATFYTDVGMMADGHPTHVGACAAYLPQFPFGTMLKLYHPNDLTHPAYTCTVEDSGTHICQNNIDVWIASVPEALQLGVEDMRAQIVGVDKAIAQDAANNHPTSNTGCELGATH